MKMLKYIKKREKEVEGQDKFRGNMSFIEQWVACHF